MCVGGELGEMEASRNRVGLAVQEQVFSSDLLGIQWGKGHREMCLGALILKDSGHTEGTASSEENLLVSHDP